MKEREVSLIDLMFDILLHWRGILVLMIIGGVCFGGLNYAHSYRRVQAQKAQLRQQAQTEAEKQQMILGQMESLENLQAEIEWLEEQLTETGIYNVNAALTYEKLYRDRVSYRNNSVLMKLDAGNIPKAQVTFWIKSDNQEHTYSIERVYENLVCSGGLNEYLAGKYNLETSDISESITLERESDNYLNGTDTFRLSVVHYDEEQCMALAQTIVDYVMMQQQELQEKMGNHEVVVVDQSYTRVTDTNIMNWQEECVNDILSTQSSAGKLKDAFSDLEQQYYNALTKDMNMSEGIDISEDSEKPADNGGAGDTETAITADNIAMPGISIKYIIAGMIAAAFLYAFILFLIYVFNNKIRETDELYELYHIPQLGLIPGCSKKKFLGFVDEWLLAFRNRNRRVFKPEEAVRLAATAVKIAAKKNSFDTIFMIGCNMKEGSLTICEQLKAILEEEKITIHILDNVLYDAEAMEKLDTAQGAVLVEKAGSTLYAEILREAELLNRQDIRIMGGIIVG